MVAIQKTIMCRLNLANVAVQFCPNYKQMRMDELTKQYVGYCSHGLFITKVIEILQSSQIRTNSKTLDGKMHVDLVALVEGVVYEPDEIIPDAVIAKVTDTIAVASSKYASININIGKNNILKVGDVTPVIVRMAQYNKFTDKIAVAANLFLPQPPKLYMFVCAGEYKEDAEIKLLTGKISECKSRLSALTADAKKSVVYFDELLCPYIKQKKWDKIVLTGVTGEKADVKLASTTLDKVTKEFSSKDAVLFVPDTKFSDDVVYIAAKFDSAKDTWRVDNDVVLVAHNSADFIYKHLLMQHYKKLYTLLELADCYPDKATLVRSSHIWKYYEMNKK